MPSVFVAFDGDNIGSQAGRALLSDDVAEVRRVSQAIEAGEEIWRSFATSCGGLPVSSGGDEGCIQIPADKLVDVPNIARQYAKAVGATVTVGIGMKISEASRALMYGKLSGKNCIQIWNPSMQATLDEAAANPKTEQEKIQDEYLGKADNAPPDPEKSASHHQPGSNPGSHAGFSGHPHPNHKNGLAQHSASSSDPPPPVMDAPPAPGIGSPIKLDFEGDLHSAAQAQGGQDQQKQAQADAGADDVRQHLAQVLTKVREQMPVYAQMQQSAPDAYQAFLGLVQGVIALGRQVLGPQAQPVAKSEDLEKGMADIKPGVATGDGGHDYSHLIPSQAREKFGPGLSLKVQSSHDGLLVSRLSHDGKQIGHVTGHLENSKITPHSELDASYHSNGLGQAMYEAAYAHAKANHGVTHVEGGIHSGGASRMHQALAAKHGFEYGSPKKLSTSLYGGYNYALKEEIAPTVHDKDLVGPGRGVLFKGLGGAEAGRTHMNLPVGSTDDLKIKVKTPEGGVAWKHVGAGMVASSKPSQPVIGANAGPTSSRNPGG